MKKSNDYTAKDRIAWYVRKLILKMRLTVLLILLAIFQVMGTESYSQITKVSLNLNNVTLKEVFTTIENKTEFFFMYSPKMINVDQKVENVTVENKSIFEVLNEILKDTEIGYTVKDRQILLFSKSTQESSKEEGEQPRSVSGKVTDSSGNPLPGVSVIVKGTKNGTVTDISGRFSLSPTPANAVLQFSFVGMKTQEVVVGGQTEVNVTLQEEAIGIGEVVAVGYGTAKKSDLTGSVISVSSKAFLGQPASSVNSVLSGKAAGVTVRRSNGAPGEGSTIRIRGANSLLGSNDPLIVVDGNYSGMPNMYDIESIEILKDASATAIYGSRGANGVILVKTKRGTQEKPSVQFYSDFSFQNISQRYDLMEPYEFAEFNNRVGAYPFTDDELAKIKANGGTDWQDAVLQTGLAQNYKAILTGGSKAVKYYISPSYNKSTGTIKNTEASGYGLSAKVDMDLNDRIAIQIESSVGHGDNLNPGLAQGGSKTAIPLCGALTWAPTESIYNADGSYHRLGIGTGTLMNPLLMTDVQNTNYSNSGSGVGNLKIKIIEGLVLDAKGSISFGTGGSRNFESKQYNGVNAYASQSSYENKSWLVNSFLTFSKTFAGVHNFSAMAGFEETQSTSQSFSATANILPIESVGWYNLGLASPNIGVSSGYGNGAMRSYFGRVNYNYASRYYLTMNYRADGSSKFKGDNQFGYFPSFSLAWRLSKEKFMKNQNVFQNVKIRGGWGTSGSQAIDNYATYTTLGNRTFDWGDVTQAGYYARVGGNPNLKWETTKQLDLGLDFTTLNNRLSVTLDYYNKKTEDLLAPVSVPAYNGGDPEYGRTSVISNVGSVRNEGFEFNINYDVLKSEVCSYNVNLNGAFNRNKVLNIGEQTRIYGASYAAGLSSASPFVLMPGQPIGTIWGLKYLGIWQENEAEEAAKFQQTPGDYKYEDLNGNYSYDADDNQAIGNTNPTFTWGFNNLVSYKNFDLNVLVEGVQGRDVMNWSYMVAAERIDFSQLYTLRAAKNRWTPANPDAEFAKIGNSNRLSPLSSQYMQDGSYVKLRNVSLAYRIPKSILSFATVKLSVSAQNILTLTKYKGYDPEISSTSGSDTNSGMDWFAYPNPKSFSFGISIEY
jgi:TonB-dependent starch-binding outer membrane protein SusC